MHFPLQDEKQAAALIPECRLEEAVVNFGSFTWQYSLSSAKRQGGFINPEMPYDSDLDA